MNTLIKLNIFRGKFTKLITKNIGKSSSKESKVKGIHKNKVKRILISRPNHRLGNILLITPIVLEVIKIFPDSKIDLFVKGTNARVVFKNYSQIDRIIELPKNHFQSILSYLFSWIKLRFYSYDISINCVGYSSSGKLSVLFSKAKYKFYATDSLDTMSSLFIEDQLHIAKNVVLSFRRFLKKEGIDINFGEVPKLNLMLSENEIKIGKEALNSLTGNDQISIAIFTHATGEKCYSKEWWLEFYQLLLMNFPFYNVIEILPSEGVSNIDYKAKYVYSTDLRELSSILSNCILFVGADSGIMHLSSASHVRTVGLFKVTDLNVYRPYGNESLAIDTKGKTVKDCFDIINDIL